jgi:hypothetical protein
MFESVVSGSALDLEIETDARFVEIVAFYLPARDCVFSGGDFCIVMFVIALGVEDKPAVILAQWALLRWRFRMSRSAIFRYGINI